MKIDWFTVIAQIVNFLLLAWLMKRYLYKPILQAIDDREKKIAGQLEDAEAKKTEAKKEQDEFRQKNEAFDTQKEEMMSKAVAVTKTEREKLLEEARTAAGALQAKLQQSLEASREKINKEISQKIQQEVFAIARKTLSDLASLNLEEQSVSVFIKRLDDLTKEEKIKFNEAFTSDSQPVLVQSAFDLSHKQQTEIKHSIKELLGAKTQIEFKTAPELVSGIEVNANGYKLGWNVSEYLNSLEKSISEIMKKPVRDQKKIAEHKTHEKKKTKSKHEVRPETEKK